LKAKTIEINNGEKKVRSLTQADCSNPNPDDVNPRRRRHAFEHSNIVQQQVTTIINRHRDTISPLEDESKPRGQEKKKTTIDKEKQRMKKRKRITFSHSISKSAAEQ